MVDVAGKVRRPGIAVLRSGRPGGRRHPGGRGRTARESTWPGLNLARVLTDGEQIVVGGRRPPPVVAAVRLGRRRRSARWSNINTADETALESLPEVGPVTAQAIIAWRTEHGGFSVVDQLLDVDGIGDATLAKLTPYVTICDRVRREPPDLRMVLLGGRRLGWVRWPAPAMAPSLPSASGCCAGRSRRLAVAGWRGRRRGADGCRRRWWCSPRWPPPRGCAPSASPTTR